MGCCHFAFPYFPHFPMLGQAVWDPLLLSCVALPHFNANYFFVPPFLDTCSGMSRPHPKCIQAYVAEDSWFQLSRTVAEVEKHVSKVPVVVVVRNPERCKQVAAGLQKALSSQYQGDARVHDSKDNKLRCRVWGGGCQRATRVKIKPTLVIKFEIMVSLGPALSNSLQQLSLGAARRPPDRLLAAPIPGRRRRRPRSICTNSRSTAQRPLC